MRADRGAYEAASGSRVPHRRRQVLHRRVTQHREHLSDATSPLKLLSPMLPGPWHPAFPLDACAWLHQGLHLYAKAEWLPGPPLEPYHIRVLDRPLRRNHRSHARHAPASRLRYRCRALASRAA
jgi:hypothetical protein